MKLIQIFTISILSLSMVTQVCFATGDAPHLPPLSKGLTPPSLQPSQSFKDVKLIKPLSEKQKKEIRDSFDLKSRMSIGGWTGNGGDGLVCFANSEIAKDALAKDGRLRDQARRQITSVTIPDVFFGLETNLVTPASGQSVGQYLDERIRKNLAPANPYLAQKFSRALSLIVNKEGVLNWNSVQALPHLNDAGTSRFSSWKMKNDELDHCRFVQIVIRYQKTIPGQSPVVFLDYDQDLFSRLGTDPQNRVMLQASLIIHEVLYLLGVDAGDQDSSAARNTTSYLLSKNVESILETLPAKDRPGYLENIFSFLGFENFWWAFIDKNSMPSPGTTASRRLSKAKMEQALVEIRRKLFESKEISSPERLLLKPEESLRVQLKFLPTLSEEQAFLFLSDFYFRTGVISTHPDVFLMDDGNASSELQAVCNTINLNIQKSSGRTEGKVRTLNDFLLQSASSYCSKM